MFWAAASTKKRFCLAAELNVRFITKVSVGQRLVCVARLKTDRGRLWESEAELRDEAGDVCVRATCKQVPMDLSAMKDAAVDFLSTLRRSRARNCLRSWGYRQSLELPVTLCR